MWTVLILAKFTFCWNGLYWLSKCNELGKENQYFAGLKSMLELGVTSLNLFYLLVWSQLVIQATLWPKEGGISRKG